MALHRNDIAELRDTATSAVRDLDAAIGRPPTQKEYKTHATANNLPTLHQVLYQFGTWTAVIQAAGLTPNENRPPRSNDLTDAELATEFIRVANRLGKMPTQMDFRSHARFSVRPYTYRWGSWTQARNHLAEQHRDKFNFPILLGSQRQTDTTTRKRLRFDSVLCFEPQNEIETIVLFSLMAPRLGFRIRSVQADFPDAELEQHGKTVLAEFEYMSSNYVQHGHDLNADCICICWRNDRDLGSIPVLALEDVLRDWADNQSLDQSRRSGRNQAES